MANGRKLPDLKTWAIIISILGGGAGGVSLYGQQDSVSTDTLSALRAEDTARIEKNEGEIKELQETQSSVQKSVENIEDDVAELKTDVKTITDLMIRMDERQKDQSDDISDLTKWLNSNQNGDSSGSP